jgi:hypothetical protein
MLPDQAAIGVGHQLIAKLVGRDFATIQSHDCQNTYTP